MDCTNVLDVISLRSKALDNFEFKSKLNTSETVAGFKKLFSNPLKKII